MIASLRQIFSSLGQKIWPGAKRYPWLSHYPDNISWDAPLPSKPLTALLEEAVQRFPNHTAIDFLGKTYSYTELWDAVQHMAAGLQQLGVRKGSRVGLFLPNSPHFVISYYAILTAGGTVVNFNPLYPIRDVEHQINDAQVDIMITFALGNLLDKLEACRHTTSLRRIVVATFQDALPFPKNLLFSIVKLKNIRRIKKDHVSFARLLKTPKEMLQPVFIEPEQDIAVLQYTGGTTGVPKGTMLTHANLYINAVQCGMWFTGLEDGKERMMGVLPCFHVFAMTVVMNFSIHKGLVMILHPQFDLKTVLKDIVKKRPTLMPGVPTIFNAINNCEDIAQYDLSSLKMCLAGGAPLPLEVKQSFEKRTGCKLVEGYGLSESSPVVAVNPLFGVNKAGSIGMPLPGTILEVVSADGKEKMMSPGKTGEICIRGPQVMKGYLNKPVETTKALKGGRLHTGDIGYMDEEGYFFIVDRLKEMIISGGYNIYPRNVEEVLYTHPDVVEAAVIGVEDTHWGQKVKAFIVKRPGSDLTHETLGVFVQDKLPRFAWPSEIEFREVLPKTMIGKISKKDLS